MPLVSVIIPAYNSETTILETVQSALGQTFADFELIVIDDGSEDATREILSQVSDCRLNLFSYPNKGVSVSRNRGLSHASGQFIAFLDADDLWTPDKLETQLNVLQATPQAAVAYSWTNLVDESACFLQPGSQVNARGDVYANLLLLNIIDNGSNPLIRRQAIDTVGHFDESLICAEDWDMWLRLAEQYEFICIPKSHILYRQSDLTASSNVFRQESDTLRVLQRAFDKASLALKPLKKDSLANLYKYLIYKALKGCPDPKKGLFALRGLGCAVANDVTLLRRRIIWKVLFKIAIFTFLPPKLAFVITQKFKHLTNIEAILAHMRFTV